jgi:hypothetical protein
MIIEKVDRTREAFNNYSLEEAILTIGGIEVDLAVEQEDQEVIITFSNHNGIVHRGMMPCCNYVAEVIIPPRRYETVEVDGPPANAFSGDGKKGDKEEEPATHTERVAVPLDMDSVILKVWPAEHGRHEEVSMAGGEENAE